MSTPTPSRQSWKDFPPTYIDLLRKAGSSPDPVSLGTMSWNDAKFIQREFYRLAAALRRNVTEGDRQAGRLLRIMNSLRISCPRNGDDPTKHTVILKLNPVVAAAQAPKKAPTPPPAPPLAPTPSPAPQASQRPTAPSYVGGLSPLGLDDP